MAAIPRLLVLCVSAVAILNCVHRVKGQRDNTACSPPQPSSSLAPSKPILSLEFETHIVLSIVSRNMTKEFHQFYNFKDNHAVIDEREYGHREYGYANYATNEMFVVTPDELKCKVSQLATDPQRFIFGYKLNSGKGHVPTPEEVLHMFQSVEEEQERYVGKQTIRGIVCDVWYSCTYWASMKSTMDLYWYFADSDQWTPSGGGGRIPIRAWIKGQRKEVPNLPGIPFEHKYDFYHWKNYITRKHYFETPRGVACAGRQNTKDVPALPKQFSFTIEQIDRDVGLITFVTEMYDMKRNLFKSRMRARGQKVDLFGDNVLDEIHDFNTGVAYIIDTVRGNCSVSPIEENSFDDVNVDKSHVTMRTAAELLILDGAGQKPVYTGVKTIRGMDADVWTAKRVNYPPGSVLNATWEWAFVNASWSYDDQGRTLLPQGSTLMQLALTQGYKTVTYYNVYNFRAEPLSFRHFDISSCYINRNRRVFSVTFPGKSASTIAVNLPYFKNGIVQAIADLTKLSPMRVGNVQVSFEQNVIVTFELLDKAPVAGDVTTVKQEVDLGKAGDAIFKAVRTNKFTIKVLDDNGKPTTSPLTADSNSVVEKEYLPNQKADSTGYSTGTTAAVAIVMVLVGTAVGGGGGYFVNKKFLGGSS